MPRTRSIAAHVPVKSVDFIEYYYSSKTNELNVTTHYVTLKLNKHVYVGRYAANSEANALAHAEDVVKGCLTKCGCRNPNTRLAGVPFKKYGFPAPQPLTDVTPNPTPSWSNVTYQTGNINVNSGQQITGINTPIQLVLTFPRLAGPGDVPWVKITSTYNASDATVFPETASGFIEYTANPELIVTNNQWVWFATRTTDTSAKTITVKNLTDNDTVLNTYTQVFIS